MKREEVYRLIDGERAYQDQLWPSHGGEGNPNPLTVGEFLLLIYEYADRARAEWTQEHKPEEVTLGFIRKIAGITVNCMEQHGAPAR